MKFVISGVVKGRAKEVRECMYQVKDADEAEKIDSPIEKKADESASSEKEMTVVDDKIQLLTVMLLVELIESLEKAMFNASDGCAVSTPPANKVIFILLFESK